MDLKVSILKDVRVYRKVPQPGWNDFCLVRVRELIPNKAISIDLDPESGHLFHIGNIESWNEYKEAVEAAIDALSHPPEEAQK